MTEAGEDIFQQVLQLEWQMFTTVQNQGARASCQDDRKTFLIMRTSQFMAWDMETLVSYRRDLAEEMERGENLMAYKYGYMMEDTQPAEFAALQAQLPAVSMKKRQLVQQLLRQQLQWLDELVARFPQIVSAGRPIHVEQAARWETSCETYLRGEMYTYSEATLELLWRWVQSCKAQGRNMNEEIWQHTARLYGRKSISEL